jgi:hypothetical protein
MQKREIQPKWKVVAKGRVLGVLSLEHDVVCDLISVMKEESKKGQVGRLVTRNKKKTILVIGLCQWNGKQLKE